MANRYRGLGIIFLINGLLEGLLVSESNFFPANIINKEIFIEYIKFPPLAFKVLVGIIIMILLNKVIETFDWEQKEKLNRLEKHRIASEERRKLGLEIHDSIIQSLYAAGLKLEYCLINKDQDKTESLLVEIKSDLNQTIAKTREFISKSTLELIELEDLISSLQQLINQYNKNQPIHIHFIFETSHLHFGGFSSETSTQIYYVVQEAICNVVKHSKATDAIVRLESKANYLSIEVIDNGIGITNDHDRGSQHHLGISSMTERTERVRGSLQIKKGNKGTLVQFKIPWEVFQNGTENQRIVGG
jgi:signal transduction histidine kinase